MQSLMILMQSGGLSANGNLWVYLGIVVAACVLGIEVACIGILIRKFVQAKRRRRIEEEEERLSRYSGFAVLAVGVSGAAFSAETVLLILAGLAVLAGVVFLALVVIFRACGYDFVSSELLRQKHSQQENNQAYDPAEEQPAPIVEAANEPVPVVAMVVEDEYAVAEEIPAEAFEAEPIEAIEEALPEEACEEAVVGEVLDLPAVPVEEEVASAAAVAPVAPVAPAEGAPAQAQPTRIVQIEKQYTETVKEVQTPAPTAQPDPETGALIEKLSTLIDKIDRQQEAAANATAHPAAQTDPAASVPASANADEEEEEDEEEDDDFDADEAEDSALGDGRNAEEADELDDPEHFTGNERIIGFDEQTGCYIVAHYRKSFTAKLIQSRPNVKNYYSELKNALLSYKGTKSRISWTADSFHNGRTAIAKINVKTRSLEIYLALDPASLEGTVYRGRDVSHLKKYADTPFQYKLRTPRKFKWAMELVARVCEEQGLSPIDIEKVDYESQYPFEDTDSLVARGLIKEYIREENPASTFELDESHVSALPGVDDTVIPANANFSWEFDNDMLAQKEPEPIPEPEVEEIPEPIEETVEAEAAPQTEAAPAPEATAPSGGTVVRETTKTTTMRYTEQYYGDPNAPTVYKEYMTDTDPFAANIPSFMPPTQESTQDKPTEEMPPEPVSEEAVESEAAETEALAEEFEATEEIDETDEAAESAEEYLEAEEGLVSAEADESDLLSAFDREAVNEGSESDLDWGIPAGLTVRTTIYTEETTQKTAETVEVELPAEKASELLENGVNGSDEPLADEITDLPDADAPAEYSEDYELEEDVIYEEYAEGDDDSYEAGTEEYAEGDDDFYEAGTEEYAEGDDDSYEAGTEEYAEGDDDFYEAGSEEYAEGDDDSYEAGTEEYTEDDASYEEAPAYRPQINPDVALVDVGVLEANFPNGSEIDLEILKSRGLVLPSAKILKISATGTLTKAFTVIADQFSMSAIIAINTTGGDAQQIIRR